VGFIEGSPLRPRFWAEGEAVRFLAAQAEPILHGGRTAPIARHAQRTP
jgi:hypothetical protein